MLPRPEAISRGLALAALLTAWALGTRRYTLDGSFWESEAFIAWSLLQLPPGELFGELLTPHSFPRVYLFAIAVLKGLFGYKTAVLRFLPWLAFLAAMALFVRGLYERFRSTPALLALGLVAMIAVPVAPAFAAMLKQYSLDMCLALLVLAIPDAFLDRRLGRGRGIAALLLLPLPIVLSYPYVIVLAARLGAWCLAGGLGGRWRIDPRATAVIGIGTAAAIGSLWWTDLRHTADVEGLYRFWAKCIVASDLSNAPSLFVSLLTGWWTRISPWGSDRYLLGHAGHVALLLAHALGAIAVVRSALGRPAAAPSDAAAFGSRALANALVPLGLLAAAWLTHYPLCANRLTLFALYPISMLALEGVGLASTWIGRGRHGEISSLIFVLALLASIAPAAAVNIAHQWSEPAPGDIRGYTAVLDAANELPIFVSACSTVQVKTLPELKDREDILFYNEDVVPSKEGAFPDLDRFIMLSAGTHFLCPWFFKRLPEAGMIKRQLEPPVGASGIWIVDRVGPYKALERERRRRRRAARAETENQEAP